MRSLLGLLLAVLLCSTSGYGQDANRGPYRLKLAQELEVGLVAGSTNLLGTMLWSRIPVNTKVNSVTHSLFTEHELRFANQRRAQAGAASDVFRDLGKYAPLGLMAFRPLRRNGGKLAILLAETYLFSAGLTTSLKAGVKRVRPYVVATSYESEEVLSKHDQTSFVSGHTSAAAAGSFFFAQVFADYYPDSPWKPVVWSAAIAVPAVTGYLRVRAGSHYPSDVLGGFAVGAAAGILVPMLHRSTRRIPGLVLSTSGAGLAGTYTF